jgi:hypothetical protein
VGFKEQEKLFSFLEHFKPQAPILFYVKAYSHYGKNLAKLTGFKEQKKYILPFKACLLSAIFPIL